MTRVPHAIDAHAHVFARHLPLAADRRYAPDYDAPVDHYLRHLDENGLTHGVLVQPSFLGTDNSYLVESLKKADGRLRGVAVVEADIGIEGLQELDRSGVAGIRLNLVGRPLPDVDSSEWKSLIANLVALNFHLEIQCHSAGLATLIPRLLDSGVQIVLDHFALPDPQQGAADPGFRDVLSCGRTRNIWVKLSGYYRNGPEGDRLVGQLYPQLRDAFGLDRLMWGSDWPHTQFEQTQSYGKSRRVLDVLMGNEKDVATVLSSPWRLFHFDRAWAAT